MKINHITSMAAIVLLSSNIAWAHGDHAAPQAKGSKAVAQDKNAKNKKVAMCSECGKPESECNCHDGHKHDEKRSDEKKAAEGK